MRGSSASFYLLPFRAWELMAGVIIAKVESETQLLDVGKVAKELVSALGLLLIVFAVTTLDAASIRRGGALLPVAGAAMVIAFSSGTIFTARVLSLRLLVSIGLISYSLYLWHFPLLSFCRHLVEGKPTQTMAFAIVGLTFVLAWLSWRFVERPARNANVLKTAKMYLLLGAGALLFFAAGLFAFYTDGFVNRYREQDQQVAKLTSVELGDYVMKRFDSLGGRGFDPHDKRRRVLVVGDSFAQDMVNAVYEANLDADIQLATFHISAVCGNLNVQEDLEAFVEPQWVEYCKGLGWYRNETLRSRIREADEVWLVSSWRPWQAPKVYETVKNIQSEYKKRVIVFGTKSFGDVSRRRILHLSNEERQKLFNQVPQRILDINSRLQADLGDAVFIDTVQLLCGPSSFCPLVTPDGQMITYDGGHLTQAGAKFLGESLGRHPLLASH